jgi:hypothetical protein
MFNQKSKALNGPTPPLPQKPVALMQRSASALEIRNLWNDRSNMSNIIIFLAELLWAILLKHILILCGKMQKENRLSH